MTDWRLSGNVLIACSCDWGCPCNFNAKPTQGFCQGGWTWVIEQGRVGDVDVGGLAMSIFAAWPKAIHEGDGKAFALIDDRADDSQREALTPLLRGELGAPWGIFINTYELSGPRPAGYAVNLAEHATTLKVGDIADLEVMPITNPVTGAQAHPEMILPEGLILKRAHLAATKTFRVNDGASFDHSGKYFLRAVRVRGPGLEPELRRPADQLGLRAHAELAVHAREVGLDGPLAEDEAALAAGE